MASTTELYTLDGVPDVLARTVTTTLTGATFSDGAVLSGSWTANYDAAGNLLDQVSGGFTITGPAGTASFTAAGTLPYANKPADSSFEIHFLSRTGSGYDWLYVDWQGENPDALALGTASLYTSVRGTDSLLPLRLVSGGTVTQSATCFLSGTRLLTPSGEMAIERLRAGDQVSVLRNGVLASESIAWVGSRTVARSAGIVPVRIRADAFAPGLPHADLLVTPDHCILVDGGLVPARMLVNGLSIVADETLPGFTFHHVELDRHGILLAENLPAESYLDTGNRSNFAGGDVVALVPDMAINAGASRWHTDACAVLFTDRDTVEPIWRRLQRRAASLGFEALCAGPGPVDDPLLRVLLDNGIALDPEHHPDAGVHQQGRVVFSIPAGATPRVLLSNSARPSDVIGPFVDDPRLLGVKISAMFYGKAESPIAVEPDQGPRAGWHEQEADGCWTDGAAALVLPAAGPDTVLDLRLVATMSHVATGSNLPRFG